jgi:cardiolipin synthase
LRWGFCARDTDEKEPEQTTQGLDDFFTAAGSVVLVVLAMNFATPEKELERKIEHRFSIADPQFRREMSVMLGPSVLSGNHVTALQNGAEIFPAMLDAIRGAQVSVNFETYIYWSGEIGQQFTEALSERARAGIPVNVTIDWVGSIKMERELLDRMEEARVTLHRYRPLHWYNLGRMNNRTHRKLLVVDGRVGFTGGVGIADMWQGKAQGPEHWRDSHYRVEGPVVAQMQAAFNDNWIKMTGVVLNGPDYFPPLEASGDVDAQVFTASPASFRLNDEASLNIYEHEFAQQLSSVFEADLGAATPYTLEMWNRRPMREKLAERLLWPIRSQL